MLILEKFNKTELNKIKSVVKKEISNIDNSKEINNIIDSKFNNSHPDKNLQDLIKKICSEVCLEILQQSHEMFYHDKTLLSRRIKNKLKK